MLHSSKGSDRYARAAVSILHQTSVASGGGGVMCVPAAREVGWAQKPEAPLQRHIGAVKRPMTSATA